MADHRGYFAHWHDNPPAPFNPDVDPAAADRYRRVSESMEADGWYATRTRDECKAEWARRYDEFKEADEAAAFRR